MIRSTILLAMVLIFGAAGHASDDPVVRQKMKERLDGIDRVRVEVRPDVWPTGLPDKKDIYNLITKDLKAAGITVDKTAPTVVRVFVVLKPDTAPGRFGLRLELAVQKPSSGGRDDWWQVKTRGVDTSRETIRDVLLTTLLSDYVLTSLVSDIKEVKRVRVTAGRRLQLTFDDGPEPVAGALNPILEEVARRRVKAAFFNLGKEVKSNPASAKKIAEKGHVLANHSWDHLEPHTRDYKDADIIKQFSDTHKQVKDETGVTMKHWRAPRREQVDRLTGLLVGPGKLYTLSHNDWHADSKDSQGATTAAAMLKAIRADIARQPDRKVFRLLFHIKPDTAKALREVLDGLAGDGHTFVDFAQDS